MSPSVILAVLSVLPNRVRRTRTRRDGAEISLVDLPHGLLRMLFDIRHSSSKGACCGSLLPAVQIVHRWLLWDTLLPAHRPYLFESLSRHVVLTTIPATRTPNRGVAWAVREYGGWNAPQTACRPDRRCCGNGARCRVGLYVCMASNTGSASGRECGRRRACGERSSGGSSRSEHVASPGSVARREARAQYQGAARNCQAIRAANPKVGFNESRMLSRHLGEMQRRIEAAGGGPAAKSTVSGFVDRREISSPPHPPPPSFGCRVSPCDRSRLSG